MSKTLDSYDKFAVKYNEKFSDYNPYQEQINFFIDLLNPESTILDMGCGTGLNSKLFSIKGHEVFGFDFSKSMIAIAKENCPDGNFTVSTIKDYNPSINFDGICLSFLIVHLNDEEVEYLINSISGFIKTDGWVYISFMTGKKPGYETTSFSTSEIFFNYFELKDIIQLFNKNSFSLESLNTAPYSEPDGSVTEDVFLIFRKDNII